ncbi:MAG: DUF4157 domain-containing protein [Clostridium sp.]|jgi:hypothetical protein|nr:DUF4157 domain-containing protein [Clostridium sp.]
MNTMQNGEQGTAGQNMRRGNETGIPIEMKNRFEAMFGLSLDDVKVHYNSDKPAKLYALAYVRGNQVYIGPGQEQCLAHELGHVIQQKQGRVRPTKVLHQIPMNDDLFLEREADRMAADVLGMEDFVDCFASVRTKERRMPYGVPVR